MSIYLDVSLPDVLHSIRLAGVESQRLGRVVTPAAAIESWLWNQLGEPKEPFSTIPMRPRLKLSVELAEAIQDRGLSLSDLLSVSEGNTCVNISDRVL